MSAKRSPPAAAAPPKGRGKGGPARGRATRRRPPAEGSRSAAATLGMHKRFRDRRRAVEDEGRRRRRRLIGSLLAVAVAVLLGVAVTYSPLFAIDDVTVVGVEGERAEEARAAAGVAPGENLLLTDRAAAARAVEALPWVADAEVSRAAPSTLQIRVTARTPVAVLRLADQSWLLDAEGVLVGGGTADGLVFLDVASADLPSVGQPVEDPAVRDVLAAEEGLDTQLHEHALRIEGGADRPLRLVLSGAVLPQPTPPGDAVDPPEPAPEVWVRLGDGGDMAAKSEAVLLILEQVAGDPAIDLAAMEIDVRAPFNPVLAPRNAP